MGLLVELHSLQAVPKILNDVSCWAYAPQDPPCRHHTNPVLNYSSMWEFKLSRAVRIMCKKLSFFLSFSCPFHICNYIYQYVKCSSHHSPILISCFEEATIITLNQSKQTNESHMSPSERASVKKRLLQFMHRMDVRQLKWDNSEWSQASTEPWTTTKLLFPVSANMFNMSSGNWIVWQSGICANH